VGDAGQQAPCGVSQTFPLAGSWIGVHAGVQDQPLRRDLLLSQFSVPSLEPLFFFAESRAC
jgi:hypothetical protein